MNGRSSRLFLLGRLHSLTGIIPLGLFLLEHLFSNAIAMLGKERYDQHVQTLMGIPFLPFFEIVFIALPLLFHAGYGIYIGWIGKNNPYRYSYTRNWMFVLQRASGLITLVFILYHVWAFRLSSIFLGTQVNYEAVSAHLAQPFIFAFYIVGMIATTFHFSNGLWTGLITWGIATGIRSQQVASVVRVLLFLALCGTGIGTLVSFW